jgi:hypothetical protein
MKIQYHTFITSRNDMYKRIMIYKTVKPVFYFIGKNIQKLLVINTNENNNIRYL